MSLSVCQQHPALKVQIASSLANCQFSDKIYSGFNGSNVRNCHRLVVIYLKPNNESVMEIISLLPFPILNCPSSFITFLLLPSFSVLPISQDWLAQKQSFFDIYAALFHAYISYLIMWCDCYMSQSLISHHVTGYALFHLFFHHCITFWWLAQPVTAFWWLTQPVITFDGWYSLFWFYPASLMSVYILADATLL